MIGVINCHSITKIPMMCSKSLKYTAAPETMKYIPRASSYSVSITGIR